MCGGAPPLSGARSGSRWTDKSPPQASGSCFGVSKLAGESGSKLSHSKVPPDQWKDVDAHTKIDNFLSMPGRKRLTLFQQEKNARSAVFRKSHCRSLSERKLSRSRINAIESW